jgi:hypothetical protein
MESFGVRVAEVDRVDIHTRVGQTLRDLGKRSRFVREEGVEYRTLFEVESRFSHDPSGRIRIVGHDPDEALSIRPDRREGFNVDAGVREATREGGQLTRLVREGDGELFHESIVRHGTSARIAVAITVSGSRGAWTMRTITGKRRVATMARTTATTITARTRRRRRICSSSAGVSSSSTP